MTHSEKVCAHSYWALLLAEHKFCWQWLLQSACKVCSGYALWKSGDFLDALGFMCIQEDSTCSSFQPLLTVTLPMFIPPVDQVPVCGFLLHQLEEANCSMPNLGSNLQRKTLKSINSPHYSCREILKKRNHNERGAATHCTATYSNVLQTRQKSQPNLTFWMWISSTRKTCFSNS